MKDIILTAKQVTFSYPSQEVPSLNQLSLSVERGHKVAFMGENGSGKSTFFLCCNGIKKPQSGTISINGMPIVYKKKELLDIRSKVGIVFQNPDNQLFFSNVHQEIAFGPLNLGIEEGIVRQSVHQIIHNLSMEHFSDKPTHQLSGGEKKQVSIADILVMKPEILILDEPTASLDQKHTQMVETLIQNLSANGTTILIATHDVDYALSFADDVVLFKEGYVLASGDPLTILTDSSLLQQVHLEIPQVLQLFHTLCRNNILSKTLPPPLTFEMLNSYIEHREDIL